MKKEIKWKDYAFPLKKWTTRSYYYYLTQDSVGYWSLKGKRKLLEELNAFEQKGLISKELWQKLRLQTRLGCYAEVEVVNEIIKILNNEHPRKNSKRRS